MKDDNETMLDRPINPVAGRLALLAFGVFVIAFLTVIERKEWFHLRPATGTAQAMFYASNPGAGPADMARSAAAAPQQRQR